MDRYTGRHEITEIPFNVAMSWLSLYPRGGQSKSNMPLGTGHNTIHAPPPPPPPPSIQPYAYTWHCFTINEILWFIPLTDIEFDMYGMNPIEIEIISKRKLDFHEFSRCGEGRFTELCRGQLAVLFLTIIFSYHTRHLSRQWLPLMMLLYIFL